MDESPVLQSFLMGGFECSSHRRFDGRRLDLLASTAHDRLVADDYRRLAAHGLRTVRDGVRWHLVEPSPRRYHFGSFLPMLEAAERTGTQVIWDLCHYGWPDDIDIWRPAFVERFAAYVSAVARVVRERSDAVPFYCVVNEISYWAWAGGQIGMMNPGAHGRGLELKHQLVRAAIAATRAIREVDPRARFLHVDPLINVVAGTPEFDEEASRYRAAQYDSWLLMTGELWPGLGGEPGLLDVVGVNHYPHGQWLFGGPEADRTLLPHEPGYRPLSELLFQAYRRLGRPMLIAETGAEGGGRGAWLHYVVEQSLAAREAGVPLAGICLYPILDYPGWTDDRHCETGLYGLAGADGGRPMHAGLATALAESRERLQPAG